MARVTLHASRHSATSRKRHRLGPVRKHRDPGPDVLEAVGASISLPTVVYDPRRGIIWRSLACQSLDEAFLPDGELAKVVSSSPPPGEGNVLLADGREIRWRARLVPSSGSRGAPGTPLITWTFEDVTVAQRDQRALDDARGRLKLLSAHLSGILFELDAHGRFVRVWTSDPQLLARPETELLGHTLLETLGAETGGRHHAAVQKTLRSGDPVDYEYQLDVPGGRRHFAGSSVAVPDAASGERHAVFWIRDITEQVELRKKLLEAERMASLGTLAAGVAHEINNPLAYMMLNAEQMQTALRRWRADGAPRSQVDSVANSVAMIHQGAKRVQRIVRELLQLSEPDDRKESVDLRQVLGLAVELTRASLDGRVELVTEWESGPPVVANGGRLVRVFENLLLNAVEAIEIADSDQHRITISLRFTPDRRACIDVSDTGTGVAPEHEQRIFQPFFTTKEHGTGLGLAICQRVVSALGGELKLLALRPHGSIFRVLLQTAGAGQEVRGGC